MAILGQFPLYNWSNLKSAGTLPQLTQSFLNFLGGLMTIMRSKKEEKGGEKKEEEKVEEIFRYGNLPDTYLGKVTRVKWSRTWIPSSAWILRSAWTLRNERTATRTWARTWILCSAWILRSTWILRNERTATRTRLDMWSYLGWIRRCVDARMCGCMDVLVAWSCIGWKRWVNKKQGKKQEKNV